MYWLYDSAETCAGDKGLVALAASSCNLTILSCDSCGATGRGLTAIAHRMTNLQRLSIGKIGLNAARNRPSEETFQAIATRLTELRSLNAEGCAINDASLVMMLRGLLNLKELDVRSLLHGKYGGKNLFKRRRNQLNLLTVELRIHI